MTGGGAAPGSARRGDSERPAADLDRAAAVDLRFVDVLDLVPVVDAIEEVVVLEAREAAAMPS